MRRLHDRVFTFAVIASLVVVGGISSGCGKSPTAPSTPVVTPAAAQLTAQAQGIAKLSVTGNTTLSAVGEISQLRATATLADGSTIDVTNIVTWTTLTVPSVVRISNGLLTADALGWGRIKVSASDNLQRILPITVTPPGTYWVWGFVNLPGDPRHDTGFGVSGFQALDTQSGRSTVTSASGYYAPGWYTLGGLTGSTQLRFDKAGYETATLVVTGPAPNAIDGGLAGGGEVKVQPLYRITAGGTAQTTIRPDDIEYDVSPSGRCVNCRLIRVVNPAPGTLHLGLNWDQPNAALGIWTNGQFFGGIPGGALTVDVPVVAGELVLYVGVVAGDPGNGITVTLTTSLGASAGYFSFPSSSS